MSHSFLITGGTGFIASNIIRELVRRNAKVHVIVRNKQLNPRLHSIANRINLHECDIRDSRLHMVVNSIKPTYIYHLARYGNLPSQEDIYEMIDNNLKGTINLISAVKQNPFQLFINTSSCLEYGTKNSNMKETDKLEPISNFGVVTSAVTHYCQKEAIRCNLPIITFRLFTPYGYYEGRKRLIPDVIMHALQNHPINLSSPDYVRDFIFIEDVVGAYLRAIEVPHVTGDIYNIGSGKQHSVKEIVEIVVKHTNSTSKILWGVMDKQARYIEPSRWQADTSKANTHMQWRSTHTIKTGIAKTIRWFKENMDLYSHENFSSL